MNLSFACTIDSVVHRHCKRWFAFVEERSLPFRRGTKRAFLSVGYGSLDKYRSA